jgi:hypothetical protein
VGIVCYAFYLYSVFLLATHYCMGCWLALYCLIFMTNILFILFGIIHSTVMHSAVRLFGRIIIELWFCADLHTTFFNCMLRICSFFISIFFTYFIFCIGWVWVLFAKYRPYQAVCDKVEYACTCYTQCVTIYAVSLIPTTMAPISVAIQHAGIQVTLMSTNL